MIEPASYKINKDDEAEIEISLPKCQHGDHCRHIILKKTSSEMPESWCNYSNLSVMDLYTKGKCPIGHWQKIEWYPSVFVIIRPPGYASADKKDTHVNYDKQNHLDRY